MNTLQPPAWPRPRGYANGIAARGTMIAVAGQIGWNAQSAFETDDLVGQVRQALSNVLSCAGRGQCRAATYRTHDVVSPKS